ncbi:DegT/DnrJ/EryC1/StrS aminotransferase family protein [Limnobacter sp.]|uniref:DegT/DnrJ/EryC1/StrS family aminotransferase n=1 Tax=Limnobacter sp. TaxID=2003368 RepID=UPI0027332407|nr:DegT/DnrJ/EryC1/StrS family aminotransferase [Limnobacter sp.]MDP3189157.1 DegT/DnrJ/EryC1/StrS family aminotransferase [Limnobacter sp.]
MSTQPFLPFALPEIGEEEIQEVASCLRSGWLTTGPKTRQFETDFEAMLNAAGGGVATGNQPVQAIAVNSATAGLHLALEAVGIGPGDEVIVPTHTFTATAEVVRYLGADPVFVDVLPGSLNINPVLVRKAITPKTKAIMPVHFAGLAANMAEIIAIAREHGLKVVEDAAHALPCVVDGIAIGNLQTDATVFSFYANKTITTGEGGMVVSRNPEIIKRCKTMRLHGINRDVFDRFTSKAPSWYYEVVAPGFKYNLTDLASAIGIHQLKKAELFRSKRQAIVDQYNQAFKNLPVILPEGAANNGLHSWHLYVLRLDDQATPSRDQFVEALYAQGIGCSVHYIPLHLQPYWRDSYKLKPEQFPVSQKAYERMVSIPLYSKMTQPEIDRVISAVQFALA